MKYAVLEVAGKQFWADLNKYIKVDMDLKNSLISDEILFNRILCVNDNGTVLFGKPYLKKVTISATRINYFRGSKSIIYKMNPKKKTRVKKGYRASISLLKINKIYLNNT